MRHLILAALSVVAVAGEVSQEEQDRIWREAMKQSAAVPKAAPDQPPPVHIPSQTLVKDAQPSEQGTPPEQIAFTQAWGIPWRPTPAISGAAVEIPSHMRGKLLRQNGDRFTLDGEITANLISHISGGGTLVDSADLHRDGSISCRVQSEALKFNAKDAYIWLRSPTVMQGYVIETLVIVGAGNGREDLVFNTPYKLVK